MSVLKYSLISRFSASIRLVPQYTKRTDDACTSFSVIEDYQNQYQDRNLDNTRGGYRYLIGAKDTAAVKKITEVALMRVNEYVVPDYRSRGYDGISGDIRNRPTPMALYLVWKTAKLRRV